MQNKLKDLQRQLIHLVDDAKLTSSEKSELQELVAVLDQEQRNFLRNRAFDYAKQQLSDNSLAPQSVLAWLEKVNKLLQVQQTSVVEDSAYFSPGDECRRAIIDFCFKAKQQLDICVFTISDDRLTEAIIAASKRGVIIRLLTDNDKKNDRGSDIHYLIEQGIDVRFDNTSYHMHHKFALADQSLLLNGSFNWTRSASDKNEENLTITSSERLLEPFQATFNNLWIKFK